MVKEWKYNCDRHAHCQRNNVTTTPAWLLDVSTSPMRLVRGNSLENPKYSFYSGRRGDSLKPMTHSDEIELAHLPKSWRDAVELTASLGFDYIWIEELCRGWYTILVDGSGEQRQNFNAIIEYAIGADLVIAAASATIVEGFLTRTPVEPLLTLPYIDNSQSPPVSQSLSIRHPLKDVATTLFESSWASSGWTFLERYLTHRQVIFADDQIFWNCNTCLRSDGSNEEQFPIWREPQNGPVEEPVSRHASHRLTWYKCIEFYTSTSIFSSGSVMPGSATIGLMATSDKVKLAAIRPLADRMAESARYMMGIWAEDIHTGLLWSARGRILELGRAKFPSWSWASVNGAVEFSVARQQRIPGQFDALLTESHSQMDDLPSDSYYIVLKGWSALMKSETETLGTRFAFTLDRDLESWQGGRLTVFVLLISQWMNSVDTDVRWNGLLLTFKDSSLNQTGGFKRIGLYVGPRRYWKDSGLRRKDWEAEIRSEPLGETWSERQFRIF
jgi:hypothetical protein